MSDFTPEDTTDYSDDDVLIRREREREQLFEQQRQMNDAIAQTNAEQSEGYEKGVAEPAINPQYLADRDLEVRTIALNSVVQTGAFNSFDEMMDNTKQVYKWLIEDAQGEAAGGPESA